MAQLAYDDRYSENAAENYERFFVPSIGGPIAEDLVKAASIIPGERVLDVGCGTGVVTRLAAEKLNGEGTIAGLDANPGMLAVAREVTPDDITIEWYEANAEAIPLSNDSFDVVLCQMTLQFIPDRLRALREMRRVLTPGGRLILNLPGPTPALFEYFAEALGKHISTEAPSFVHAVFALNDAEEVRKLANDAGFSNVQVKKEMKPLELPGASDFMWQYIHSTPLVSAIAQGTGEQLLALEQEVCELWKEFSAKAGMAIEVGMTTLIALR